MKWDRIKIPRKNSVGQKWGGLKKKGSLKWEEAYRTGHLAVCKNSKPTGQTVDVSHKGYQLFL